MDSKSYAAKLEKKLITEFKSTFFNKLGYYPTVITQIYTSENAEIPIMSLEMLEHCLEPFMPVYFDKRTYLQSKSRNRPLVELRNIFCLLARQMGYSLTVIGKFLKKDHTTVIHAITACKNLLETCEPFQHKYTSILKTLKSNYEPPIMDNIDQVQCEPEPAVLP
jgi:hypothetical protein